MKERRITVALLINRMAGGGAEQQLLELARGLDKSRFRTLVVPLYPGGPLEQEVRDVPGAELISLDRKGRYDFLVLAKIARLLQRERVDVVQPFLTPATFFGLVPALLVRTPVKVVTERCGVRVSPSVGNRLYRRTEDFLTRFAERAVPNSKAGRTYLMDRGIDDSIIKVIYNGINLERLTPDPDKVASIRTQMEMPPGGVVVGITASLTPAKDHVTFMRAARIIRDAMPQARFGILGEGPLRAGLEGLSRELGLEPFVTFFGRQQDVGSYVSCFDVACLCSSDLEGCSNATLEAMALGRPVVITDVGGNREVVTHGENGLLIPARSPAALAEGVLGCLSRPEWAKEMGRRAKQTVVERFGFDRMVSDYEDLYEQAMRAKAKTPVGVR